MRKETKVEETKRRREEVGVAVTCTVCHMTKQPIGRSAPLGMHFCDCDCEGYRQDPKPGDLWPGESREDFGYPKPVYE